MNKLYVDTLQTEALGLIGIAATDRGLAHVRFFQAGERGFVDAVTAGQEVDAVHVPERTVSIVEQIQQYLQGERRMFEMALDWSGLTDFQKDVLQATLEIPYGETRSYGEVAAAVGRSKAARAVGQAESRNPCPLVVPCHRVIGADGALVGYGGSGDVNTKAWLLAFESHVAGKG